MEIIMIPGNITREHVIKGN